MYNNNKRGKVIYTRCHFSTKDTPLNTAHIASFIMNVVPVTNVLCGILIRPFWSFYKYITQGVRYIYHGVITVRYIAHSARYMYSSYWSLRKRKLIYRKACLLKETTFAIKEEMCDISEGVFFSEKSHIIYLSTPILLLLYNLSIFSVLKLFNVRTSLNDLQIVP